MRTRRTTAPAGFTLVELLVIIAIIATLASLMLPALAQGTVRARNTQCLGLMRQWAIALDMYVADFGCYPADGPTGSELKASAGGAGWGMQRLDRYLGRTNAVSSLHCPEQQPSPSWHGGFMVGTYEWAVYNYNSVAWLRSKLHKPDLSLSGRTYTEGTSSYLQPLPDSGVIAPSETIGFFEGSFVPQDRMIDGLPEYLVEVPWTGDEMYLHRTGSNFAFCDGHAETVNKKVIRSHSEDVRRRWFNDNQPHPEAWW